jgi:hypothetical protein
VGSEERLRWMGVLVESEPLGEGRFRDVFEDHGHRVELEAEVARSEPPRLLEVRLVADAFAAKSVQRLEPSGDGTILTTVVETEYTKRLARLAAPFVTRHAQQQLEADLAALKALVEAG